MGRSKNKNKLHLKYQNNHNNTNNFSNNKIKDDENHLDENESENSQNVLNNQILLKHIKDIQNINENILVWNDDDVIDDNKSKVFHQIVKNEIIKKSIKKSAFSKYLKYHLKNISKINPFALSGVIMKSDDSSDKNNIILNEISSNNYSTIETKKQSAENLNIFDLPEEIENVDTNSQQLKLSQVDTSPNERPVRRSGRSAKINYKEMLNVQIFEVVNLSEQHSDAISPKKKSRMKREPSKRLSVNELEDNVVKEENDKISKRSAYLGRDEVKSEVKNELEREVAANETNNVLSDLLDEADPSSNKMCCDVAKEENQVDKQLEKGRIPSDNADVHQDERYCNDWLDEPRSETPEQQPKQNVHIKKRYSKDPSRQCVLCTKPVMGSKRFMNLCYKCLVSSSKVIIRMGLSGSEDDDSNALVCLDIPPCLEGNKEDDLCDACQVQNLLQKGVEWGPDFNFMSSFSLEQLRSTDAVMKARLASQKQMESSLLAFQGVIDSRKSCILSTNKPMSTPCKWDIRYFTTQCPALPASSHEATCYFCQTEGSGTINAIYWILPAREHAVCHNCLLSAHSAYKSSADSPRCAAACSDLQQCPSCLLRRFGTICPADSVEYRFYARPASAAAVSVCEICLRSDPALISVTRAGHHVCQICTWRIKLFHFRQTQPCPIGKCSIGKCDGCLVDLAERVMDKHQIIPHAPKLDTKLPRKSSKRSLDSEDAAETKPKRPCTTVALPIIEKDTRVSPATDDHRPRRIIRNTQFNDFIVDKCLSRSKADRVVRSPATGGHRRPVDSESELPTSKLEKSDVVVIEQQGESVNVRLNDDSKVFGNEKSIEDSVVVVDDGNHDNCKDDAVEKSEDNYGTAVEDNKQDLSAEAPAERIPRSDDKPALAPAGSGGVLGGVSAERIEEVVNEELSKPCRRIKQAMQTVHSSKGEHQQQTVVPVPDSNAPAGGAGGVSAEPAVVPRANGPRVKQVSRQNVNADINLDNARQKCVVKRGNRITKKPESLTSFITTFDERPGRRTIEDDTENEEVEEETRSESKESELQFHGDKSISFSSEAAAAAAAGADSDMRCGVCSGCLRNRCCGKCDPCLLNKSQRRKTEICVKMVCTYHRRAHSNRHSQSQQADSRASSYKLATVQPLDSSTDNADKSADEIAPPDSARQINGVNDYYVSEVYRDSDSDDLSSEEEQLDPELDSIHTVKGDLITTGLAHEGGFPVITSVKAQPNKVLCFSCGSGGDQMIHCVSCAEPFHFFCIEYQFRPKSKEMFVCRNCTKCHSCQAYGSDLKCIKCQLGFHPRCVIKYPPSKSEDRSNWACYKCAMCLHCGAKAEDMMNHVTKSDNQIDWSRDPWQCGRCARARKDGHVCPECGRAYQSGLETLECSTCARMVHRQCSGLTEDEYEIFKCDPEANRELSSFTCSKCVPEAEDDQKKRIRLKRQCKESSLKKYCERGVSRKMNEFIHKGETHEEMLLEQHNLSDSAGHNRSSISNSQFDGVDDEFDKSGLCESSMMISLKEYDNTTNGSPSLAENYDRELNQTNSTMFYSSESTGECDMEPLNIMDLEPTGKVDIDVELEAVLVPRTKIGIFSRLNASEFISPKHLIMEALARISVKLSRYPIQSQIHKTYDKFLVYIQELNEQIFPWVDFSNCFETVQSVVKKFAGRGKLMMQTISDNVRGSRNREFDVFSSSISEIEEKLSNSFQRGREEFIIFHSEQHLAALMKSMESHSSFIANNDLYTTYSLAFRTESSSAVCEKDVRTCALCDLAGDDGLEGRLIYGGLDVWVHVNCALWSDDVYEKEDGALVNVDLAIKQGESSICSSCKKHGATVRCSAQDSLDGCATSSCSNIYHFACAFNSLRDPVFTELRSFYCSTSHKSWNKAVEVLGLEDMPILRRIYLPQGCLGGVSMACSDGIPSDQIVITIGNLRINCLGKIDHCSDSHKLYLCPVEYQARRLYWSMHELDSLVMYSMSIEKEINVNKNSEGISPVIAVPVVDPMPTPHRRRMIEMPEHRVLKRPKTMGSEPEIIYEMDDAGNLQPISGPIIKIKPTSFSSFPFPEITNRKVNRRFPMNNNSNLNRMSESKIDLDLCAVDKAACTTSLPCTSYTNSDIQLRGHQHKTSNNQCLLTVPAQYALKSVESSPVLPQQMMSQSMVLPVKHLKPVMLRFNSSSSNTQQQQQQRSLPQSLVNQLRLNKNMSKPLTFINVGQPMNRLSTMSSATVSHSNNMGGGSKLVKLVKLPGGRGSLGNIVSNHQGVNQQVARLHPQAVRIIPSPQQNPNSRSIGTLPSVLRTALTDNINSNHRFVQQRPQITSAESSAYRISACGSLLKPSTFPQYDGEADDASVLGDDVHPNVAESICCSDQDAASTAPRARAANKPRSQLAYKYCLKFVIHGYKESKTPKACWSNLARRIGQMRKMEGLDDYELRIGDGWSKFGLDHRHVIYLIEQMVGAFQCGNYDFKFHKNRANLLRQQCLPVLPSTSGCARFSPWSSTKPEHFARDPLAFLLSKCNLPPKNHAPASADQNDDSPDPDEDYLQTLASQFSNLKNGVKSREENVRVCCSNIHGRGLFARRQFDAHEIIIEYVGEIIRSVLSDVRETEYQRTGVDCYMFRLDHDYIVDATCKGNAARFINHSCHPNCYAKVVRFEGEKHIIIIAQRQIYQGEELTYDYRFPIEDDKLPCTCGSFSCKKYLN